MLTRDLEKYFLDATESAAIAAAAWIGRNDGKAADGAAVEAMRKVFDTVPFDGRVAIGEGERDKAPMLYIGEVIGKGLAEELGGDDIKKLMAGGTEIGDLRDELGV